MTRLHYTQQIYDTALHTEYENKGVNDVNESMQTSSNVTENNSSNRVLWENIDVDFRLYILEIGPNQKTNISFTCSKRMYDDDISRYLKKEHIYRVLTNQNNKLDSTSLILINNNQHENLLSTLTSF